MVKNRRFETETQVSVFGMRHLQCLLLFFALLVAFATRVNLSVAIVVMTSNINATNINMNYTTNTTTTSNETHNFEQYEWSEKTKSMVLSSFFWGYFVTQIPGGQLAHMFGGKILLLQSILVTAVLTLLTPFAVKVGGWKLLCGFRFMQGLSQGVLFPTAHTVISKWAPVEERSTLGTYTYLGSHFGTVTMLAISGALASSSYGWPSIFYVSGVMGLIWVAVWFIWGANSPSDCKAISVEEKNLIETSLGKTQQLTEHKKALKTPWSKIFTSVPFWVLCAVHCANNWGFWTLLTQIPRYMKNIMGMDIKSNALLTALPYVAFIVLGLVFCAISNQLQKRKCLALTTSRKLFTTISLWIPMIALIALGYVSAAHIHLAVILLIITIGFNAAYFVGWNMNHIELSPNFGGVLMGLTNCAANVMSFLAPLVVGFVVVDEQNAAQWRIVFFISGGFYFFGNLLFMIFGSAKVQHWNDASQHGQELQFIKIPSDILEEKN